MNVLNAAAARYRKKTVGRVLLLLLLDIEKKLIVTDITCQFFVEEKSN